MKKANWIYYPPSQKTILQDMDKNADNATADVTNGQAVKHLADNPPKPKAKALWRRRVHKDATSVCRSSSSRSADSGLSFWFHFGLVMQLGLVIAVCILVGLAIGLFLDKIFKTKGIFLVMFLIMGIIAGFRQAYKDIMGADK